MGKVKFRVRVRPDIIISFTLTIICVYHVSNIVYNNIYPDVPEILVYEKKLNEIEFPISFLLCLNQFENDTLKFRKFSYKNVQDFFIGQRMYNARLKGWKGHKVDGSVVELEEIVDGISTNWKYFVNNIRIDTTHVETHSKFQQNISGKKVAWSKIPIYPNCQALDLMDYISVHNESYFRIEQIKFKIRSENKFAFFLYTVDRKKALTKRMSVRNMLAYSGPIISNQIKGFTKEVKVALKITQNKFSEEDQTNPCAEYPNEDYQSFEDCDEIFVYHEMKTKHHIMPFWATDNLTEVTDKRYL